jgi:CHAT domain-containing protein
MQRKRIVTRGRGAMVGLLAAGLAAASWVGLSRQRELSHTPADLRSQLIGEVGPIRPFEARLAGLDPAPAATQPPALSSELLQIFRKIQWEAGRDPSPDALGARALANLILQPDPATRLGSVLADLEQATSRPSAGAHLWSDLAAAYLASADRGDAWNYPRALEAASRAIQINGDLAEARFNFALALEKNLLREDAWRAWAKYRDLESDSFWLSEAYNHQNRLERPSRVEAWEALCPGLVAAALRGDCGTVDGVVKEFPFRTRRYAEDELLPAWADAFREGRTEEAERDLVIARSIGAALATIVGEHLVADSVAVIHRLSRAPDQGTTAALATAYLAYVKGRSLCGENQSFRGSMLLEDAKSAFRKAGSPEVGWIDYHLAVCAYQQGHYREAIERLERLLRELGDRYPSLLGRVHWMLGLSHLRLAEPGPMLESYESALEIFVQTGAALEVGGICNLLGEAYSYLGDRRQAWRYFHRARAVAAQEGDLRRLYTTADQEADLSAREGLYRASLHFRNEVLRLALSEPDPPGRTHAFLRRAETWSLLGRPARAWRDLQMARRSWELIPDEGERRLRNADLSMAEGRLLASDRPLDALSYFGRALEIHRADNNRYALVGAYLAEAKALLRVGRASAAELDLRAGIREFERQRGQVHDEELRIAYFEQARELFDLLIGLQVDRPGGEAEAFEMAERQRARVLLDRLASGPRAEPLSLAEIRRRLPPGVAVIAYASLSDRLLVWIVRHDEDPHLILLPVPERVLAKLVSRLWSDLEGWTRGTRLKLLSSRIFEPIRPYLRPGDRLVFIPNKSLHAVPFCALRSSEGHTLVENYASVVAPSASLAVKTSEIRSSGTMNILVVADPDFDTRHFPGLPRLPGARKETAAIRVLFRTDATLLSGAGATREAFEREAGHRAFLHFGTHAVLNPDHPYLSRLLLAPAGPDDPGTLNATEIQSLALSRTRLVSLAACRTGAGKLSSEGVLSLGRAFLAAGVPVVLASLRDLNDTTAARLSTGFFQRLRQGAPPAEALRQTQLDAARNGIETSEWASLQILGGI